MTETTLKRKIERAGGIYKGIQKCPGRKDYVGYVDPETGTYLANPVTDSVTKIRLKMERRRKLFR